MQRLIPAMALSWQKCRNEFNHDWLKNKYLNRLKGFSSRISSDTGHTNINRIKVFIEEDFHEWHDKRIMAGTLIASFESDMSPRNYFILMPLSKMHDTHRKWLENFIHSLWIARNDIKRLRKELEQHLEKADCLYGRLDSLMKFAVSKENYSAENLRTVLGEINDFIVACEELSSLFSSLPHDILVV